MAGTRFQDKIILVTGGTSGIGLATAVEFALAGAKKVIVCGRRLSKWQDAQAYLLEKGLDQQQQIIEYWPCDVRVEAEVATLIQKIFDTYGQLDVCFNNAGVQPGIVSNVDSGFIGDMQLESLIGEDGSLLYRIPPPQPTSKTTTANINPNQHTEASPFCESEIATSCIGVFYCLKWEMHYVFDRQPKDTPVAIINTSSRNGVLPDSHRPLYAASKAFILSITRSVATQVAQKALRSGRAMVRVNAVSPGPIDTPLEFAAFNAQADDPASYQAYVRAATTGVPMERTGHPEEIAHTVLFLADQATASYITGANFCVDGGHTGSPILGQMPVPTSQAK